MLRRIYWTLLPLAEPFFAMRFWLRLARRRGPVAAHRLFRQLPPGPFRPIDERMRTEQRTLLDLSEKYGPVFKCNWRGDFVVMLTGFETALAAFATCPHDLRSTYKNTDHLFPIGHLRAMYGDTHRHYRQIILRGLRSGLVEAQEQALRRDIQAGLCELQRTQATGVLTTAALISALRNMTTRMLLRLFIGVDPDSAIGRSFHATYDALTPGLAPALSYRTPSPEFEQLTTLVTDLFAAGSHPPALHATSVLIRIAAEDRLDPTSRGIVLYMLETGRFDLYSLFRWTLYYLANHPQAAAYVAAQGPHRSSARSLAAEAFVQETLRSNQSEAIQRRLSVDRHFAGHAVPQNSQVQVCMWENHKDPAVFPEPFAFNPSRFIDRDFPLRQFAPFGIDDHRCAAADHVVSLTRLFVEEVVQFGEVSIARDAPPERGRYHWEPGSGLVLALHPRNPDAAS